MYMQKGVHTRKTKCRKSLVPVHLLVTTMCSPDVELMMDRFDI